MNRPAFDLARPDAARLEALYARTPGVFLHHAGHTHRNKRTIAPGAPGVVFQEVAATKEYPGGLMLLRLHTGGYALKPIQGMWEMKADMAAKNFGWSAA